jgi:hypothetical protein
MGIEETAYEMPLETEDSYNRKIELGEVKVEEEVEFDDNWIPDILLEEE